MQNVGAVTSYQGQAKDDKSWVLNRFQNQIGRPGHNHDLVDLSPTWLHL